MFVLVYSFWQAVHSSACVPPMCQYSRTCTPPWGRGTWAWSMSSLKILALLNVSVWLSLRPALHPVPIGFHPKTGWCLQVPGASAHRPSCERSSLSTSLTPTCCPIFYLSSRHHHMIYYIFIQLFPLGTTRKTCGWEQSLGCVVHCVSSVPGSERVWNCTVSSQYALPQWMSCCSLESELYLWVVI